MKKTIQTNIGSRHFHMDEDAYQLLNQYLESLKDHFKGETDGGREVIEDIEQRIAELLENKITDENQSVSFDQISEIITILGKVEDFEAEETGHETNDQAYSERREKRRFYRDVDDHYLGGVASGLGAYFDIDPLWIRLAFVALVFLHGAGILIYIILWIVVPAARTTAEKLQMRGIPVTLSTIRDSVNAEYEQVRTGYDHTHPSDASRRSHNALDNLIRAVGLIFVAFFKFIIGFIGIIFLIAGVSVLVATIMILLAFTGLIGPFHAWPGIFWWPHFSHFFMHANHYYLLLAALIVLLIIPVIALIYGGIKILFNIRTRHKGLRAFVLTAWILALFLFIALVAANVGNYSLESTDSQSDQIENHTWPRLYIRVHDNLVNRRVKHYSLFDRHFMYDSWDRSLYSKPVLTISRSDDQGMYLSIEKRALATDFGDTPDYLDRIRYDWQQNDSIIYLDRYLSTEHENFWMFGHVNLNLRIPQNQVVILSDDVCELLNWDQESRYCSDSLITEKPAVMTANGLMLQERLKLQSHPNK